MRTFRSRAMVMVLAIVIWAMVVGCAANKYQIMYGISDWYYTNHVTLQAQYDASTPEQQAWLRANVNPYMNIMQQVVIGMGAVEKQDDAKLSKCITEIVRIGTGVKYNVAPLVSAIRAKDYDAMETQALALKSFIIQKLGQKK